MQTNWNNSARESLATKKSADKYYYYYFVAALDLLSFIYMRQSRPLITETVLFHGDSSIL